MKITLHDGHPGFDPDNLQNVVGEMEVEDATDARLASPYGKTPEQWARDLMELCGDEHAQSRSAGDVVFLAEVLRDYMRSNNVRPKAVDVRLGTE